eukprot:scaffold305752_cov30-Tisochrysis_lutea.AAC.1
MAEVTPRGNFFPGSFVESNIPQPAHATALSTQRQTAASSNTCSNGKLRSQIREEYQSRRLRHRCCKSWPEIEHTGRQTYYYYYKIKVSNGRKRKK